MATYIPKWHKELEIFRGIKPCIILEGNILDTFMYPEDGSIMKGSFVRLIEYLHYFFKDRGYENIAIFDSIRGFTNPCEAGYLEKFAELVGANVSGDCIRAEFPGKTDMTAAQLVTRAMTQIESPTVVIMDLASRYIADPVNMNIHEVEGYTILLRSCMDSADVHTENGTLKNMTVLLVNKLNDLPAWFYLTNPNVKSIVLPTPTKEERSAMVKGENFPSFFRRSIYEEDMALYEGHQDELEKLQDRFIGLTEGFTFTELNGLRMLSKNQRIRVRDLCSVIDLYKFGIKENPWDSLQPDAFRDAYNDFEKRVKGQRLALTQVLDVVKRAMTGMADITSSAHGKPKGVLFFAGPTGTGKTETAKTLAEKLFGDERACIRFDMSEFAQPHSDQRLLGAPPGYVGYEAGGQLTNAVKNNPFSILLFDEIEKAHPSILDKFLQILEDGRMTDGKGETVYFSESIIIFTSNLGIYERDPVTGVRKRVVDPSLPYSEVQQRVRQGIENYFKLELGRPEILNRIGENIVVFDFIREEVAQQILSAKIEKIASNLRSGKQIDLTLSENAYRTLLQKALSNLDNGGRGIGNIVESMFVNPLSRYMFDAGKLSDCAIRVESIQAEEMPYTVECD